MVLETYQSAWDWTLKQIWTTIRSSLACYTEIRPQSNSTLFQYSEDKDAHCNCDLKVRIRKILLFTEMSILQRKRHKPDSTWESPGLKLILLQLLFQVCHVPPLPQNRQNVRVKHILSRKRCLENIALCVSKRLLWMKNTKISCKYGA